MRLVKSPNPQKKWRAIFEDGTTTDFGSSAHQDYTQHHSETRRALYRQRHKKDLATKDPKRAGYLAYYLLWGDSTSLEDNLRLYKARFGL